MTDEELLDEARKRYQSAVSVDKEDLDAVIDHLKFLLGGKYQWDTASTEARAGRPMLTVNKLLSFLNQVVGGLWQNRPQSKIRPSSPNSSSKIAELLEGKIRHIENISNCNIIDALTGKAAMGGGRGWQCVNIEDASPDSFDQELYVRMIPNVSAVAWDQNYQELDLSDIEYFLVSSRMNKDVFKTKHPEADMNSFDTIVTDQDMSQWITDDTITVAKYYKKVYETYTLCQIEGPDGALHVVREDALPVGVVPLATKRVKNHKWVWYTITGTEILDGPNEWPSRYTPILPAWGRVLNVNGKWHSISLTGPGEDSARLYNYEVSQMAEVVALAPKNQWQATPAMLKGHEHLYDGNADGPAPTVLPFNPDKDFPGMKPERNQPGVNLAGFSDMLQTSDKDMRDTVGLFSGSTMNDAPAAASGAAITARRKVGETGTQEFPEALSWMIQWRTRLLLDLLPKVYNGESQWRIQAMDGSEKFVHINRPIQPDENEEDFADEGEISTVTVNGVEVRMLNSLDGEYDCTIEVGPSYNTRMEQAFESIMVIAQGNPQVFPMVADIVFKLMGIPESQEIAKRFKAMLPPEVQALMPHDEDEPAVTPQIGPDGQPIPDPNAPPVAPPDPNAEAMNQKILAEAEKIAAEIEKVQAETALTVAKIEEVHHGIERGTHEMLKPEPKEVATAEPKTKKAVAK